MKKNLFIGIIISSVLFLIAIIGLFYTPYDPNAMDTTMKFAGVSLKHIMGCDNFGRDIFSRVMRGLGTTITVAIGTNIIGLSIGIIVGSLTGYFGGLMDEILMRFNDAVLAFPSILLALVFVSCFGTGKYKVMVALGIVFVPSYARIVRSEFLRCRNMDYVKAARLMNASDIRIMFVHILPNAVPVIASSLVIGFNNAVLAEAGLSFLGIGVQPPDSSLGRMLSEAQSFILMKPSYAIFTGSVIIILIVGFALLSDGIKEVINA